MELSITTLPFLSSTDKEQSDTLSTKAGVFRG